VETLSTQRLNLISLSLSDLKIGLNSINALSEKLGIPLVDSLLDGVVRRAVQMKNTKMEAAPRNMHPWFTYWLICIKEENTGIGFVGYKGSPDEQGVVEIGYGIDAQYRGKGYMTEAVKALVSWAFTHTECQAIIAPGVLQTNIGSQHVLEKSGFQKVSSGANTIDYKLERDKAAQ
jgi:[ribosomal protein S5]-alanine N-acetyltransferase